MTEMMTQIKKIFWKYREAYSGLPRAAWMLGLVELVNRSGSMVFFYFALYLTQTYGFTPTEAGRIIGAFGLGALLGAWLGGKLTDRMGAYWLQKVSLALNGLLLILLGYVSGYGMIAGVMFITGCISETLHPANATAMSQICPAELRVRGFALQRLAVNLGVTIGPVVGGFLAMVNYKLLFWIDGLTCLAAAGIFVYFFRTSRPEPILIPTTATNDTEKTSETSAPFPSPPNLATLTPTPSPSVFRDTYFLKILFYCFLMGLAFVQLFGPYSIYMKNTFGLKENQIGFLLSINTIIIVLFEMLLMEAIKKRSLEKMIGYGAFLLCAGFGIMPLGSGFFFAAFTVVVWTLGEMLAMPALTTLVANHSDESMRGKYMGLFSLSFSSALLAGPILGTWIYDHVSPNGLWLSIGALGFLLLWGFHLLGADKKTKNQTAEATSTPLS